MDLDAATTARAAGAARAAIGIALLAAPGPIGKRWLGDVSERPGAQVAISGLGARDLALGLGTAWAAGARKRGARAWVIASGAADLADLVGDPPCARGAEHRVGGRHRRARGRLRGALLLASVRAGLSGPVEDARPDRRERPGDRLHRRVRRCARAAAAGSAPSST